MTRTHACPIGGERIDATAARLGGALVASILVVALVADAPWLVALLAVDLVIKIALGFKCSPVCRLAGWIARSLRLEPHPVDSAAKRFATLIALVMALLALVFAYALMSDLWFQSVLGVWLVCALLESVVDFCLGCYLYGFLPGQLALTFVRSAKTAA